MNDAGSILLTLWLGLGWPLTRLLCFIALGLLVANFIEALNWSHSVARLAAPIIRLGRLPATVGASFSMAFFSGVAANTMLSEAYDQNRIDKRELILANLFNSMPTYFLHLPTVFFITAPLIKGAAVVYVALTFLAAVLRTGVILIVSRFLLTSKADEASSGETTRHETTDWRAALRKTWKRFRKKMKKVISFTVPIYIGVFALSKFGMFDWVEALLTEHVSFLSWLNPQSVGIVVFHVAAEFTAGLAVAGALLDAGTLAHRDIILALLVGNVLSSPMRAVRHQFPYYAGIFSPKLAVELIIYSQVFRTGSIILAGLVYYFVTA